jgi:hypothetical protein
LMFIDRIRCRPVSCFLLGLGSKLGSAAKVHEGLSKWIVF